MNVYLIYSFKDYREVEKHINSLREIDNLHLFYFRPEDKRNKRLWHEKAKEKIKQADVVCYFFNFSSVYNHAENIKWEYAYASELNKKIIIIEQNQDINLTEELKKLDKDNQFIKDLFNYDYAEEKIHRHYTFAQGEHLLTEQSAWSVEEDLMLKDASDIIKPNKKAYYDLLIKQYGIMVETSEKLMERRQAMCNLYVSVCTALVALVGSSFALKNMLAVGVIFVCVAVLSIILSLNWLHSLISYDKNNEGKFAVLNEMEKRLPANMFDTEYKYNKYKGIRSFSYRERKLPLAFIILGVIFAVVGAVFIILGCLNINIFVSGG